MKLIDKKKIEEHLKSCIVRVTNEECWLCPTYKGEKYSKIEVNGIHHNTHRLAGYVWLGLDIENRELYVLHKTKCKNKNCINPDHLYIGTQIENMRDVLEVGNNPRSNKTHCPQGHEYTKDNTLMDRGKGACKECKRIRNKRFRLTGTSKYFGPTGPNSL